MARPEAGLIGYWPLAEDTSDHSPLGHATRAVDVQLGPAGPGGEPGTAARFNGQNSLLEVADHPSLHFGAGDVTVAAWVCADEEEPDVVGDIVSKFDPDARKGLQLYILTNTGVTSTAVANYRSLQFGIDNAQLDEEWADHGRPGNAVLNTALTVLDGRLYCGTLEIGADEMGHLWRYEGDDKWTDLGNPVGCNVILSVSTYDGALYCTTGRYHCHGSRLGAILNTIPGGKVFRVEPDGTWVDCGQPGHEDATPESDPRMNYHSGKADDAFALTQYRGKLYCTSSHRNGVFVYQGGREWKHVGLDRRIISFTIYRGRLYALINGGPVYRYEGGAHWEFCGSPSTSTQTYGAVTIAGRLYVGTWPEGEVYRYEGGKHWLLMNRVGYAREIMAMAFYNGKGYLGALPMANAWRIEREGPCTFVGNLDSTPTVLRRVWSMAVYQGRLFAGTLPSGHVRSIEAGRMATWDQQFPEGWHHVAAVKEGGLLRLYLDGEQVAASTQFGPADFDLSNDQPLRVGMGNYQHFAGLMSEVRLYDRALNAKELAGLADA